jgi:polyisoprenyl-phosphate glycosyltransferase
MEPKLTRYSLSLVVPVFNEAETIPVFIDALNDELIGFAGKLEVVFVDDGSSDGSTEILERLCEQNSNYQVVILTRNFGKEAALMAGLRATRGEAVIPIDVDLQDPIRLIPLLFKEFESGAQVVWAKRSRGLYGNPIRFAMSKAFRRFFAALSSGQVNPLSADFRLMSREVVEKIIALPESQLYMKGLMDWVGFRHSVIEYTRSTGLGRPSKFSFKSLVGLGIAGLLDFSTAPLRFLTFVGLVVCSAAFGFGLYVVVTTLLQGNNVPGFTTLLASILFLGGANLAAAGLLGEYVARILVESKRRPPYIIRKVIGAPSGVIRPS